MNNCSVNRELSVSTCTLSFISKLKIMDLLFLYYNNNYCKKTVLPSSSSSSSSSFKLFLFMFSLCFLTRSVTAYKNYTVGDTLGWFDKLEKPAVNYANWASGKTFGLGDFLIFNSDSNHSVVQTYNFTTFHRCDYDDSSDNDTIQWSSSYPTSTTAQPQSVAVPLLKVGLTYFFSSDYDGEQCKNGQQLSIKVTYGQGLPPSLKTTSSKAPAPVSPDSGDDDSAPDTLVPSSFNNPQNVSDDGDQSSSVPAISKFRGFRFGGVLIVGGIYWFSVIYIM